MKSTISTLIKLWIKNQQAKINRRVEKYKDIPTNLKTNASKSCIPIKCSFLLTKLWNSFLNVSVWFSDVGGTKSVTLSLERAMEAPRSLESRSEEGPDRS